MANRTAAIAGAVLLVLGANLLMFGTGQQQALHREQRRYRSVAARATTPILHARSRKSVDDLAECLSSNPTGRFRMTALTRGVRDQMRAERYDRVVLHEPMGLIGGITARTDGSSDLVMLGRPGRALQNRERATIVACR